MRADVEKCLQVLQEGGLILYPTDTIWGIGCDATNAAAINRIFRIKRRDDSKSLIILLADEQDIPGYVTNPSPAIFDFLRKSGKPTTVIYRDAKGLPANLVNQDGSIAIRVVNEIFCQSLIRQLGRPIVSTSANISGEPSPRNFAGVSPEISEQVDYTVFYRRDDPAESAASRIVKISEEGNIEIIRP